ncbi:MAG: hypothetical protein Kow0022_11250 [Phycisphaerales bacterium]
MHQAGARSYEEYRRIQTEANVRKFRNIWATPVEMDAVAELVKAHVPQARFGLCHGARNGQEVRLLRERLAPTIRVIGTDISPTANAIPDMVQWDFHELHPDWTGTTDFLYSNSWDHTYDIRKLASTWAATLGPGGIAIIHWTRYHSEEGMNDGPDTFGCGEDEIARIFTEAGLQALARVRLPAFSRRDLPEVTLPILPDREPEAPLHAHYVDHDSEVVLIPFRRPD